MEDLKKQLETLQAQKDVNDTALKELNNKMYAEIQVINDKYADELIALETKQREFNEQYTRLRKEIKNAEIMQEWQAVQERGEINESYLTAMMRIVDDEMLHNDRSIKDIIQKPVLPNGIAVWKVYVDTYPQNYNFYLAFKGMELVGISYRDEAKHAGDGTVPFSFIGQFKQVLQKRVRISLETDYYNNMNFTNWYKELAKLDADEIPTLPMSMATLQELKSGVQGRWNEYGWEKTQQNIQ